MNESKNILENAIIKQLSIYHAIGEVKLMEMISHEDDLKGKGINNYQLALSKLYRKGIIEIVLDKTNSMSVIRLINVYH